MSQYLKCRKCRIYLFDCSLLVEKTSTSSTSTGKVKGSGVCDVSESSAVYVDWESASTPEWLMTCLTTAEFCKGKLACPQCAGRIGSFDFVSDNLCQCGEHMMPPVHVTCSKVDLCHKDLSSHGNQSLPKRSTDVTSVPESLDCEELAQTLPNVESNIPASTLDSTEHLSSNVHCDIASCDHSEQPSVSSVMSEDVANSVSSTSSDASDSAQPLLSDDDTGGTVEEEASSALQAASNMNTSYPDVYTCPICLEIYYQPFKCQPCHHVFCQPCLRRLSGTTPVNTRCPLCRERISSCLPDQELTIKIETEFAEEYRLRHIAEKPTGRRLPPLPRASNRTSRTLSNQLRRARSRGSSLVLAHLAGVCFVVLLVMLGCAVLATTLGMVAWYLYEYLIDLVIDIVIRLNEFFDAAWTVMISALPKGHISPQEVKILAGSFGQVLYAFGKFFNQTQFHLSQLREAGEAKYEQLREAGEAKFEQLKVAGQEQASSSIASARENYASARESARENYASAREHYASAREQASRYSESLQNYYPSALEADIANYFLIMAVVTYFIYRLARHINNTQQRNQQLNHPHLNIQQQ